MEKNFLIIFFFFIITKIISLEESEFAFLENKTLDHLRQIFWSSFKDKYLNNNNLVIKGKFEDIWEYHSREKVISILTKEFNYFKNIPQEAKENTYFNVKNLTKFKEMVTDETLHKNYLINFAFNIDKYDRTQRRAINSVYNYLNFYTREQIIEFINQKIDEYSNKTQEEDLLKIILNNNIDFNYKDTKSYTSSKTTKDYIQFIYGYENYCYNSDNKTIEDSCYGAYNLYTHSKLDSYSKDDFNLKLPVFHKKLNLDNDLDEFIFLIENRQFNYPNNYKIINSLENVDSNIIALEKYFKRKTNTTKSLKHLDEYIKKINNDKIKKEILEWGINLFPELGEKGMLQDIISNENYLQYGQVKEFIRAKHREELLKFAINIHIYQKNITSIYDKEIYDFIRMNENKLYEILFQDTNNNKILQENTNFTLYATLFNNNLDKYLKHLQRNQLKVIYKGLIELNYNINEFTGVGNSLSSASERKEKLDSINISSNTELIDFIKEKGKSDTLFIFDTQSLFKDEDGIKEDCQKKTFIMKYFDYYINIMDFLRSTDINYLRLWLRKYEIIIRRFKAKSDISGGAKNLFMNINEYSKNELLSNFDEYIFEYPDLFEPKKFIKIVGLDTGITPHKYLVENFENEEIINETIKSITGHILRKNIQLDFFNWEDIISKLLMKKDSNNTFIKNVELYFLFKMINICPELNNKNFFYYMCINKETRILNSYGEDIQGIEDESKKEIMAQNINYYYIKNKNNQTISDDIDITINSFLSETSNVDEILKLRVLDGDFYPIFYDYSLFLKDENEIVINNIYKKLLEENKTENLNSKDISLDNKIKAICEAINNFKELQDPSYFDQNYNKIDYISEGYSSLIDLLEFLEKRNNREIFYYCLIANIILLENKKDVNNGNIKNIYLKIHFMSRISMMRYILDVAKLKKEFKETLSPNKLPNLVKKYMLDIGSDNIYDLAVF